MPNLKHLLEELEELGVEPKRIRIPGQLYDNIVADAEDSSEEEEDYSSVPSMLSLVSKAAIAVETGIHLYYMGTISGFPPARE
jgi:hypothetical protein